MKYVIVLPDGAADYPLSQLDGRTPLQAAEIPNIDWVAVNGTQGLVQTVPENFTPGTDVATLSLFGYAPATFFSGRAPLEAAAQGLTAKEDQLIFRCNFVTIQDGLMKDFTAGHIEQDEADRLIAALNELLSAELCDFHAGVSYRNLMLASNALNMRLSCQPPHDIPNQPIADYLPKGAGADRVIEIMNKAAAMLADHPVNKVRIDSGKDPVTHIWLWGEGRPTVLEPFAAQWGMQGVVISGVDIIRGIAKCMGMELIEVPGATGYLDTNYAGKGRAGVEALDDHDLVVIHVEAPDEAGHEGDVAAKIDALQKIDDLIVGPMLQAIRQCGAWRVLIAPDHPTPCATKAHSSVPPPFCYAGTGIEPAGKLPFSEANARSAGVFIDPGHTLMEGFMRS